MSYFWGRDPYTGNILLQCIESVPQSSTSTYAHTYSGSMGEKKQSACKQFNSKFQ